MNLSRQKKFWTAAIAILIEAVVSEASSAQSATPDLIPFPASVTHASGGFSLNDQTVIVADAVFTNEAALLADELRLPSAKSASENRILLTTQGADLPGDESYRLEVNAQGAVIRAQSTAGAFYGSQTLRQLIQTGAREIAAVQIADEPRYIWRGFMLDVSRHFFDESTVKQIIDWMADYKLNRLHLHLTDDQAWRFAVNAYPELTQTGARGNFSDSNAPAQFFTWEQLREIIAYAAQRHIVVVPEIDMPGHASAATRTFPQLDGGANTFNPARTETYEFLQNVLTNVMEIFPSPWIHIGGDEVNLSAWKTDPEIAKKIRADGLKNAGELQEQFMSRMAKFVVARQRIPLVWDETVAAAPPPNTLVFWWEHNKPEALQHALDEGYSVVLTPRSPFYFDYPQDATYPTFAWKLVNTPEDVYAGTAAVKKLSSKQQKQILGVEGCLWTEHITTVAYLQFMILPRLAALAETAWTPDSQRNYTQFNERLKPFLAQYRQLGVHYYDETDPFGSFQNAKNVQTASLNFKVK